MGRIYYVYSDFQAVSTVPQDLLEITAGATYPFRVHEVIVSQSSEFGESQSEQIRIAIKRASGAFTSGSGGASATIKQALLGDAASGLTAERNNTTQAAAGSGALDVLIPEAVPVQGGYGKLYTPETREFILPTDAFIVSVEGSIADAITFNAWVMLEELG